VRAVLPAHPSREHDRPPASQQLRRSLDDSTLYWLGLVSDQTGLKPLSFERPKLLLSSGLRERVEAAAAGTGTRQQQAELRGL